MTPPMFRLLRLSESRKMDRSAQPAGTQVILPKAIRSAPPGIKDADQEFAE